MSAIAVRVGLSYPVLRITNTEVNGAVLEHGICSVDGVTEGVVLKDSRWPLVAHLGASSYPLLMFGRLERNRLGVDIPSARRVLDEAVEQGDDGVHLRLIIDEVKWERRHCVVGVSLR